jgi:hypothetical protein
MILPISSERDRYYIGAMKTTRLALALLLSSLATAPALAGASGFTVINGTDASIGTLQIRRAGTQAWQPLGSAPSPGARGDVGFKDPDCAFDIQGNVPGKGPVTWGGINLCDVKSVTLKHDSAAGAWVDYDQ